ncbi:MAG: c-type cytochrome [Caulobacterales bacterium]|jgi:cytochrome c553|nr:c-type cytochrome [Caulobacterales bacterium]
MKKFVLSAIALAALLACAPQQTAELTQEELVARGEYLVNNIGGCNDCHTPMTPQGPDTTQALRGATLGFAPTIPIPWAPVAPPIAGVPEHYTQAQFAAFLQTGVRPDGSRPLPPMPAFRLNEADARAMTAYIATLRPASAASE